MSLNLKKIILLFLCLLYFSSINPVLGDSGNNWSSFHIQHQMNTTQYYQKTKYSYTDIDPIYISGNNYFTLNGFSGSGAVTDPYLLENYRITNKTEHNLVWIKDTDAYFIIRNNFIDGINKSPTGIYLSNVTNGIVETNTIVNTNQAFNSAWNSHNNVITNNTIKDNNNGITASYSHNSNYTCNKIFSNTEDGIDFNELLGEQASRSLSGNIINSNTIYDNGDYGIFIECGTNNLVMNNSVENNLGTGIRILDGEQNTIYNNAIIGNKGAGLLVGNGFTEKFVLYASSNITSNTIMDNREGLIINNWGEFKSEGGPNNVSKNIIAQNEYLSLIVSSSYYTITENIIYENDVRGIEVDANSSLVKWNDFIGNLLESDSQAYCSGYHNTVSENYWDDWIYPDDDADGIVDNPYPIGREFYDASPLTTPHNDLPEDLHLLTRPRILYPTAYEKVKGTITVRWCPVTDFAGHSVSYSLYYSDDSNGDWEELATDLTTTEYRWNTNTVENDFVSYLKVVAKCSEGVTSEYVMYDDFDIENVELAPGWSFTILTFTLCLLVFASRRRKNDQ